MKLGPELLNLLEKTYEPLTLVTTAYKRYDLAIKADQTGKPILAFIGKKDAQGKIKGQRFARQEKGHWDNKGKT